MKCRDFSRRYGASNFAITMTRFQCERRKRMSRNGAAFCWKYAMASHVHDRAAGGMMRLTILARPQA
jgi:hypothetical protein